MSNIKFHATNWMKRFLWMLMWSFSTLFIYAQPNKISLQNSLSSSPKYEVRAVWLTTIGGLDWPHTYARTTYTVERQKQELRTLLDQYQRAGINTVLLQTRVRGTVIYLLLMSLGTGVSLAYRENLRGMMPWHLSSTNVISVAWNCMRGLSPYLLENGEV